MASLPVLTPGQALALTNTSANMRMHAHPYSLTHRTDATIVQRQNLAYYFFSAILGHAHALADASLPYYRTTILRFLAQARSIITPTASPTDFIDLAILYAICQEAEEAVALCDAAAALLRAENISRAEIESRTTVHIATNCQNSGSAVARTGLGILFLAKERIQDAPAEWDVLMESLITTVTSNTPPVYNLQPPAQAKNIIYEKLLPSPGKDFVAFLGELQTGRWEVFLRERFVSGAGNCMYCHRYRPHAFCFAIITKIRCIASITDGFDCVIPTEEIAPGATRARYSFTTLKDHRSPRSLETFRQMYDYTMNLPLQRGVPGHTTTEQLVLGTIFYRRSICLTCAMHRGRSLHRDRFGHCTLQECARGVRGWDGLRACARCERRRASGEVGMPGCMVVVMHNGYYKRMVLPYRNGTFGPNPHDPGDRVVEYMEVRRELYAKHGRDPSEKRLFDGTGEAADEEVEEEPAALEREQESEGEPDDELTDASTSDEESSDDGSDAGSDRTVTDKSSEDEMMNDGWTMESN